MVKDKKKEPRKSNSGAVAAIAFAVGVIVTGLVCRFHLLPQSHRTDRALQGGDVEANILSLQPSQMKNWDIATANLLCAQGLPGGETIDVARCLATIEEWTARILRETKRNEHRFKEHPSQYNNSRAEFYLGMLVTVLKQDIGVSYNPELAAISTDFSNKAFEKDSRNTFIHGILLDKKRGTCASLPILITAIARRLGYPVFIVPTKGHLFVRWDDGKERLNMEAACGDGFNTHPDEYYKHWPMEISQEEIALFHYFEPMTPDTELSTFLGMRALCISYSDKPQAQSFPALARAHVLAPNDPCPLLLLHSLAEHACRKNWGVNADRIPMR